MIPLNRPDIGPDERANVAAAMGSGYIGTSGAWIELAEEKLAKLTGRKYAVCASSGTAALTAALRSSPSILASVWCPEMTFAGVHNAIHLAGGYPWKAPSNLSTWQADKETLAIAEQRRIGCYVAAPCYGHLSGVSDVEKHAKSYGKLMIEDASQSFWGTINGRKDGTFGDVSIVSFNVNKIVTAGGGGVCLTDSKELAAKLRSLIRQGPGGFNGGMTNLHAAVLCAQLDRADEMLRTRRYIKMEYLNAARKWVTPQIVDGEVPAPWTFAGIPPNLKIALRKAEQLGIEVKPTYCKRGLVLPLFSAMTRDEIERVADFIRRCS